MYKLRLLIISLITVACLMKVGAQGLRFHGNECDIADRSALTIPSPNSKGWKGETLDVNFDIKVNNPHSSGFLFGLKNRVTDKTLNLMLRNNFARDSVFISLTQEGERELCTASFSTQEIVAHKLNIQLKVNAKNDSGEITIDGKRFPLSGLELSDGKFEPQLNFGLTRHIVETASITLSGLSLTIDGNKHDIPLNESDGTDVHDTSGKKIGLAFNPLWQIKDAYYWKKIAEFSSKTPTGCSYDPLSQKFYSYNRDSLTVFEPPTQFLTRMALKGKGELPTLYGMNFFSRRTGKIYPYEIYYNNFSGEIDPITGEWRQLSFSDDDKAIHHHAHVLCDNDSSALLFGGYGDRRYFNLLVKFNLYTHRFDTIPLKGAAIDPRFFASMTATPSGDTIYLYGGKGNREGKQDLGVKYYYDLYMINLKDSTSSLLWQRPAPGKDRVPARTLLFDGRDKCLYAMAYPEYRPNTMLQLYRISLADGGETAVGDSIPMISEEIATNVALHQSLAGDTFYCVVQEFGKEGATNTRIYSIAAPPVTEAELQTVTSDGWNWVRRGFMILAIVVLLALIAFIMVARRRRKKGFLPQDLLEPEITEPEAEVLRNLPETGELNQEPVPIGVKEPPISVKENKREQTELPELPLTNRLSLFGPFTAIDSSGLDISHMFSKKLRLVFIYMLMMSLRRGGVSASDLTAVFWPDKEPDKVKNLRNVTLAKLRKVLTEFTDLDLVYENNLYTIQVGEKCWCDIQRLYRISDKLTLTSPQHIDEAEILSVVSQGKFLQSIEDPEVDSFRSSVDGYVLDSLMKVLRKSSEEHNWRESARWSRAILSIDSLSDIALEKGIEAYMAMDNRGLARSLYEKFALNYQKAYGEKYHTSFAEFISR